MSSRASLPEYQPLGDTKLAMARYVTLCLWHRSGDITRQGFRVTSGLIFWYVTLNSKTCDICIMPTLIFLLTLTTVRHVRSNLK